MNKSLTKYQAIYNILYLGHLRGDQFVLSRACDLVISGRVLRACPTDDWTNFKHKILCLIKDSVTWCIIIVKLRLPTGLAPKAPFAPNSRCSSLVLLPGGTLHSRDICFGNLTSCNRKLLEHIFFSQNNPQSQVQLSPMNSTQTRPYRFKSGQKLDLGGAFH